MVYLKALKSTNEWTFEQGQKAIHAPKKFKRKASPRSSRTAQSVTIA